MYSVLSVMGPNARALLGRVSPDDVGPESLGFSHTREIDLGHAGMRAARMSYVGGPGFELYVPIEMARHVYLALHEAGDGLGLDDASLKDAGYYALDALRIESGRRAWGAELGPDETPFEAGLAYAVKLDKAADFIGRAALLQRLGEPLKKKLVTAVLESGEAYAWGGEALQFAGRPTGELSSVGWSRKAAACVDLGYLRGHAALRAHHGTPVSVDLWGEPQAATAWDVWPVKP